MTVLSQGKALCKQPHSTKQCVRVCVRVCVCACVCAHVCVRECYIFDCVLVNRKKKERERVHLCVASCVISVCYVCVSEMPS